MVTLYHFWSEPPAQRVRLALSAKGVEYADRPLAYHDDETFFELGIARQVPVLALDDGRLITDSVAILEQIDDLFPTKSPLVMGHIDDGAWQALLDWRRQAAAILERLYAAARPAYQDIGGDEDAMASFKAEMEKRFGMSVEALANDRYSGYAQLERLSHLPELARYLATRRFYMGELSIADCLLAADLYPLQVLDGLTLPVDLMYYLKRVEDACQCSLRDGLIISV